MYFHLSPKQYRKQFSPKSSFLPRGTPHFEKKPCQLDLSDRCSQQKTSSHNSLLRRGYSSIWIKSRSSSNGMRPKGEGSSSSL